MNAELDDLLDRLERTTGLSRSQGARVVEEVLAYFRESAPEFVIRRHADLRAAGVTNAAIFDRIAGELEGRRFTAPELSERQIRRLVYG